MSELKPIISLWYGRSQDEGTYTAHMTVSGLSSESQAQVAVNHMRTQFAGEELAHQDGPCAQTAQAMPASCGECGKKTSDGWALYCVDCMEKAGLPAQAVPLLSEDDMLRAIRPLCHDDSVARLLVENSGDEYRAIEQAVRAKLGAAQWLPIETAPQDWGVTKFDVWANDARFADCWWGKATYEQEEPGIVYQSDYDCNGPVDSYVRNATHWMPLPPPPIVGKEGA